jgi:hypothetical protein
LTVLLYDNEVESVEEVWIKESDSKFVTEAYVKDARKLPSFAPILTVPHGFPEAPRALLTVPQRGIT